MPLAKPRRPPKPPGRDWVSKKFSSQNCPHVQQISPAHSVTLFRVLGRILCSVTNREQERAGERQNGRPSGHNERHPEGVPTPVPFWNSNGLTRFEDSFTSRLVAKSPNHANHPI